MDKSQRTLSLPSTLYGERFLILILGVTVMLMLFPALATWLPSLMR